MRAASAGCRRSATHAAADSRRSFRQRAPECGARAAPRPPHPSMLCAGVSVDLLRRVARAPPPLLCALRRARRTTRSRQCRPVLRCRPLVSPPPALGPTRCARAPPTPRPRCFVPARGCVASRALLSAALRAVPRWPRYALMFTPLCAQAPIVGAAAARTQWRDHTPALLTAVSACATTCAITRCAGVVARRAQRRTRHALRYDSLPFERARSRLRPPILCCDMLIDPPTHRLAATRSIRTPHNTPLTSLHVLIVQVGATRRGWRM